MLRVISSAIPCTIDTLTAASILRGDAGLAVDMVTVRSIGARALAAATAGVLVPVLLAMLVLTVFVGEGWKVRRSLVTPHSCGNVPHRLTAGCCRSAWRLAQRLRPRHWASLPSCSMKPVSSRAASASSSAQPPSSTTCCHSWSSARCVGVRGANPWCRPAVDLTPRCAQIQAFQSESVSALDLIVPLVASLGTIGLGAVLAVGLTPWMRRLYVPDGGACCHSFALSGQDVSRAQHARCVL